MRLHCLGTVGFHPNGRRHTSCYFLPADGIILDAGTGTFRLPPLIETETLDIFLSHAHLDHTFGLTTMLDVLYESKVKRLRVWGEAAKLDAVQRHLFSELIFPVPLDAEWMPIDSLTEVRVGEVILTWRGQDHPGGSLAYRLDWSEAAGGKRLVYATDTTGDLSDDHAAWAVGADLLMHECYFRDGAETWARKTGHSWTSRVIEVARRIGPTKLLLTHINPLELAEDPVGIKSMREGLEAEVLLAEDEMVVEF